jgi:hypothetical protein
MNNDAPQEMSSALQQIQAQSDELQAQNDELVERLLTYQQETARHRRSIDLLRALPLEVHQRIGPSLVQDLVQAERQRAADQAARESPSSFEKSSVVPGNARHRERWRRAHCGLSSWTVHPGSEVKTPALHSDRS